jgi:nicotinic acid mononucleotide adenylyltransferase
MDNNIIGLVGGGFKPPTLGHLNMVLKAINDNPNISEIIIFVGGKQRDTISQEDSINIWDIYKDLIPVKSQIISTVSPIKAIWDYVKENPTQNILFILGQRGQSDEDLKDAEKRTKGLKEKYPNVSIHISQTSDDSISGTKAREALEKSAEEFFKFLPQQLSLEKKQKIYNMLKPSKLNESNSQFGYRAERSGPQTPSERLKDKGIGLTNSKVGLLGSGYYFFGSLDKTQDLKSKLNYDNISQIDLSQYNLYRPENPEDFYHNIKLVTYYIHSLKPEEIQNPEVQEALDDAIDAFSEYFNIPLNKTKQIFNQYIDDILNKRDGDLL